MGKITSAEQTCERLINSTGQLIAEIGVTAVSTRAIAHKSGENIGSIHYHFGNKNNLFKAVVKRAISNAKIRDYHNIINKLTIKTATPTKLSLLIRSIVHEEIDNLFRSNQPLWHTQVIYQILQRDDELFEIVHKNLLIPDIEVMWKFFKFIEPSISQEHACLRTCIFKLPIYSHINYMVAILKSINASSFDENYLQQMEELLTTQTQLLLGLPIDAQLIQKKEINL